jgi:Family of unknown function (DUF5723)
MPRQFNLLLILFVFISHVSAGEYEPYATIQSFSYSEPVAIKSILDKWQPPFKGGDKAFTYSKAELGVRWDNWQFGFLQRLDYQLGFSPETAELIYLTKNRLPLEAGKEYELRIKAQHSYSRGLRLAYQHKVSSTINVGLAASYLQGKALTNGSIQGIAQATAEKDYDFQFDTDYFYSRDVLFERDVTSPTGNGYSLDLHIDWRANKYFSAQLDVVDLIGKIFWNNTPFTIATASSDTKTFDADGYVRYQPVISGFESNKNFTQTLPRKIFIAAQYQWSPDIGLLAELQDYKVAQFTSIGAEWCYRHSDCFQSLYNTTANAVSLRYLGDKFYVELASDKLDPEKASYFVLQLLFNQIF